MNELYPFLLGWFLSDICGLLFNRRAKVKISQFFRALRVRKEN